MIDDLLTQTPSQLLGSPSTKRLPPLSPIRQHQLGCMQGSYSQAAPPNADPNGNQLAGAFYPAVFENQYCRKRIELTTKRHDESRIYWSNLLDAKAHTPCSVNQLFDSFVFCKRKDDISSMKKSSVTDMQTKSSWQVIQGLLALEGIIRKLDTLQCRKRG